MPHHVFAIAKEIVAITNWLVACFWDVLRVPFPIERIHVNRILPTIKNHFKHLCVDDSESCDEASVDRAHG